eukprot:COSAG06_NODE_1351_length_9765_cov_3.151976_1_plen_160_part_00
MFTCSVRPAGKKHAPFLTFCSFESRTQKRFLVENSERSSVCQGSGQTRTLHQNCRRKSENSEYSRCLVLSCLGLSFCRQSISLALTIPTRAPIGPGAWGSLSRRFVPKRIILPRQARDKHRETHSRRDDVGVFSLGAWVRGTAPSAPTTRSRRSSSARR